MAVVRSDSVTLDLCRFVTETSFEDLPPEVVHECKRLTLDLMGNAIAGYDSELGMIIARYASHMGGIPRATIIGDGSRTSPYLAAHVNTRTADALDFTDTFMNWAHLGPPAVLTAMAIGEDMGASGKEFIGAAMLGLEAGLRLCLCRSVKVPQLDISSNSSEKMLGMKGALPLNELAATAAAAKALRLDTEKATHAFGITGALAGMGASATRWTEAPALPLLKYGEHGRASSLGVYAGYMASLGLTAHPAILDGENALWKIRGLEEFNGDRVCGDLGEKWFLLDDTYKPWPACRFTHHALTAFIDVIGKHKIEPREIERVVVRTHPWANFNPHFKDKEPVGIVSCEFNVPHAIAMVALGTTRGPAWYSNEMMGDEQVKVLRRKVYVELEESCRNPEQWFVDGQVGKLPTRVVVHARGQTFEGYTEYAKGDPRNPTSAMSDEELFAKFRDATSHRGDGSSKWENEVKSVAESVFELDKAEDLSHEIQRISKLFAVGLKAV
ncbi:MmgE/PrpD family protein [Chloroflexota bacterium]